MASKLHVVTGAFSYTGRYIAQRLAARGDRVRTLTNHVPADASSIVRTDVMDVAPLAFDDPDRLTASLAGADTVYNTYWVRFPRGAVTFASAVANTRALVTAAERAGVRRVVHVSVTNPSESSPLPYFSGKAAVERAIAASRISWAILRPTVVFGREDILVHNIAWILRRFPLFPIPGAGDYQIRPVAVEDVAELAVRAGDSETNATIDAVGPETYTFEQLVEAVARAVGRPARIVHVPPLLMQAAAAGVGLIVGDVVLTRDEISGLMANLLVTPGPATGTRRFSEWLEANGDGLGRRYRSELARHFQ